MRALVPRAALAALLAGCARSPSPAPSSGDTQSGSASTPSPATASVPTAAESSSAPPSWFEPSPGGALPKVTIASRDGGGTEWTLLVESAARATLTERALICPERWEKRCWRDEQRSGGVPAAELDALFSALRSETGWQETAAPGPGQRQIVLSFERDGTRSSGMAVGAADAGARVRAAVDRLRAAWHATP